MFMFHHQITGKNHDHKGTYSENAVKFKYFEQQYIKTVFMRKFRPK